MKKHIFGILIFGAVFGLTALGFAYFYTPPMLEVDEISEPLINSESPVSYCPQLKSRVTSAVESSQIFVDENKLVSKIKLKWNGESAPPLKIYVDTETFTPDTINVSDFQNLQTLENPFKNGREAEIIIESKISGWKNFNLKQNYYTAVNVSENDLNETPISKEMKKNLAQPVLLAHGKNSMVSN